MVVMACERRQKLNGHVICLPCSMIFVFVCLRCDSVVILVVVVVVVVIVAVVVAAAAAGVASCLLPIVAASCFLISWSVGSVV